MSKNRSFKVLPVFALATALALGLGACSSGGGDTSDNGDSAPSADAERTFTYAAVGVPSSMDAWTQYEGETHRVNAFEWGSNLVEYAPKDDACEVMQSSSDLAGNLAESWEYNEDQSQLLITLREGVQSAAGNTLTAEDVVWSFDRARTQSSIVRFLLTSVAQYNEETPFEVVDERTVAINIDTPTALDMPILTWAQFAVLDSTEVQSHATEDDEFAVEWMKTNLATFGPWQLDSFEPGSEAVYTQNPNFWDADGRGNIDKLVIRAVPEASTRLQLLESGSIDYAEKLNFAQYLNVDNAATTNLLNCASPNRDTLMLNQQFEPFADVKVRQAVSYAIDREALTEGIYNGLANPAKTGVSDAYWQPGADADTFEYDPDRARQLLEEAGVNELSFTLMASPSRPGDHSESLALQIQSMLRDVGVTANIRMVPGATEFSDEFFEEKYEAVIYTEPPAVADPHYSLNLYNSTESFQNTFSYDNAEYDALAKQIQTTDPGDERNALIAEVSDLMVETMPQVYLADTRYLYAFSEAISGFNPNPGGSLLTYHMDKN